MALPPLPTLDPQVLDWLANRLALLAGQTNRTPEITSGIAGTGSQGTANTAHLTGQSGTAGARGALPMSLPTVLVS